MVLKTTKNLKKKQFLTIGLFFLIALLGVVYFLTRDNSRQDAEQTAVTTLYLRAAGIPQKLQQYVDVTKALDQSLLTVQYNMPDTYAAAQTPEGNARWDIVIEVRQEQGGGLSYEAVTLISCIRYTMSAKDRSVHMEPLVCPSGDTAPSAIKNKSYAKVIVLDASRLTMQAQKSQSKN